VSCGKRNEDGGVPPVCICLWRTNRAWGSGGSSLERRWSSRRFPYGYLVTTSPQSLTLPWSAASIAG
jgi:hypothetical protein